MKHIYFLLIGLLLSIGLQAQVEKTINNSSGNLKTLLTATELTTVTHLTVTGTMDARDFRTMKFDMPYLESLDIREVTITAYSGYGGPNNYGTIYDMYTNFPDDEIPRSSFAGIHGFKSIIFPLSCKSIADGAFGASGLTGELSLPPALTYIGLGAFSSCINLTGDLVIPPLVTVIDIQAFYKCSGLTSLILPPSVREIGYDAFNGCTGLQTIEAQSPTPIPITDQQRIFEGVDKTTCVLKVPYATRELYASAPVWRDFATITEEEQGFLVSHTSLRFEEEGGTNSSIHVKANTQWSASSDQPWLLVSPASGDTNQTITVTVEANPTSILRQGTLTFSSEGLNSQFIEVKQGGIPAAISITAGGLASAFTEEQKATLSKLILTGTMDARDFRTIRFQMPMLETLDISGATIVAYTDTTFGNNITFRDNAIPSAIWEWNDNFRTDYSISEHPTLSVVKLPASLELIGYRAFYACTNLTTVEMQSSVTTIGNEAFYVCTSLTSINLPASVTSIGEKAFESCISLASIELPPTLTVINYSTFARCSSLQSIELPETITVIGSEAFNGCSELQSIVIPPLVTVIYDMTFNNCNSLTSVVLHQRITEIGTWAFQHCTGLTSLTIPKSVNTIGSFAFYGCTGLRSIYAYPEQPVVIGGQQLSSVFDHVDKVSCILYVPYGSKELYASAYGWKDFLNIIEMGEFTLTPDYLTLEPTQQSAVVELTTALEWTATTDQSWLTVTPASGSGNTTFTLQAEANPTVEDRTAFVIYQTTAGTSPTLLVTQRGNAISIELTAGSLYTEFPDAEQRKVNKLMITGTMDARDFKFIRDELPFVTELDLSGVTIVAYEGEEGTYYTGYQQGGFYTYPANEIPISAFEGYDTNIRIDFPTAVTSIGDRAFRYCSSLTEMILPSTVTFIGASAFEGCYNLTGIELPPALTTIEDNLFLGCSSLTSLTIPSAITYIGDFAFAVCMELTNLEMPNSVTYLGRGAFEACYRLKTISLSASIDTIRQETFNSSGLTSIRIPASVKYIDKDAFIACHNLTTIYAYPVNPPDLSDDPVFTYLDKTRCILYVPFGSKAKYAAADQWKDFFNIIEIGSFELSYTELTIGAGASIQPLTITTDGSWSAVSDKEWITVSPAAGNSTQTIEISASENTAFNERTAMVTFSAANGYSQTLQVTQQARINSIPMAHAGADQRVVEGETVQLDGSASEDADDDPMTFRWTAPEGITLSSTNDARPTFTAPRVERDTAFTFKLVVEDEKDASASDEVIITVTNKTIELSLSEDSIFFESKESHAEITLTSNIEWTVNSDQPWLSVNPDEGTGNQLLAFTANANDEFTSRRAIVTVSAPETEDQTIVVTQKGLVTKVAETAPNRPLMSYYPNPFKENIYINIFNPQKDKITVYIYNMAGQRVKNLTIDNRAEKITLSWDGTNEQGQKVTEGMYLLKMNEVVKQVVKGK